MGSIPPPPTRKELAITDKPGLSTALSRRKGGALAFGLGGQLPLLPTIAERGRSPQT